MEDQVDPVDAALPRVRAGLADLAAARLWARSDGQSRELVAYLTELRAVTESVYLAAVREHLAHQLGLWHDLWHDLGHDPPTAPDG